MVRLFSSIIFGLASLLADDAIADDLQIVSVRDLMVACRDVADDPSGMSESEFARATRCSNFVGGYLQGFAVAAELYDRPMMPVGCMSVIQWAALFVDWAERHPEAWHRPAGSGLTLSVTESRPCGAS